MPRRYEQVAQKTIDQEVAALQAKLHARAKAKRNQPTSSLSTPITSSQPSEANVDTVSVTTEDLKTLLADSTAKLTEEFKRNLEATDKKNLITSIILSTIFLILGWALSIVASPNLLTHLGSH